MRKLTALDKRKAGLLSKVQDLRLSKTTRNAALTLLSSLEDPAHA